MPQHDILLFTELIVIILVVLFQWYHSLKVYLNIRMLSGIFDMPLFVRNGFIERKFLKNPDSLQANIIYTSGEDAEILQDNNFARIALTETEGSNESILRIRNAANTYLLHNHGAVVNFSIIKDIIDREVDAKDEEISQSVPTPLYLGLAATMVGIIFGLIAMPEIDGTNFSEGINRLIDGVKLAMSASLSGLLCTTILSSFFYKRALKNTNLKKNSQLSYLQAKLLPELLRAEDTGVSGLKASLDRFAREATTFTGNVHQAAIQTGTNLQIQDDIIARLENLNMTKVSRANLELFSRLESNMEAFQNFSRYLSELETIASNLKDFASRTSNIDKITGQISNTLSQSGELIRFLTAHFEKIEKSGSAALIAVDLSDSYFRESVELLKERTNRSVESLFSLSDKTESDLKETFDKITGRITEATARHIDEFVSAYGNAVPRFKQLELLQPIQETLNSRSEAFISQSGKSNQAILCKISELTDAIINRKDGNSPEGLENAIRELTRQLTGREPSRFPKWKKWVGVFSIAVQIIAWIGIIVVCTVILLHYLKYGVVG
jgi:hypothetical protein